MASNGSTAHPIWPATEDGERAVMATVHPSSVLRAPPEERPQARAALVDDLRVAARFLAEGA